MICLGRKRQHQWRRENVVNTIWGYISLKQAALNAMCTGIKQAVMDEEISRGQRALDNLQKHLTTKDWRKWEQVRAPEDTHCGGTIGRGKMRLHW